MRKSRLENLIDSIFAFSMTLLVLTVAIPTSATLGSSDLAVENILSQLTPDLIHYVIAFLILAGFWIMHHHYFEHIHFVDQKILWLNILALVFVTLIPFSTNFSQTFVDFPLAAIVLEFNILMIGLIFCIQWLHATKIDKLLKEELGHKQYFLVSKRLLIIPLFSIIAIFIALLGFTWSPLIYAIMPIVYLRL